jgi:hypothetical protein
MQLVHAFLFFLILGIANSVDAGVMHTRRSSARCQPFQTSFSSGDDVSTSSSSPLRIVGSTDSYSVDDDGLKLYLEKPPGTVHTKDGVNDVVAEGATVNSTFYML